MMMIRVDVHPKCVHFGLGLGLESYSLGLGLATAGLDYIPARCRGAQNIGLSNHNFNLC